MKYLLSGINQYAQQKPKVLINENTLGANENVTSMHSNYDNYCFII